MIIIIIINFLGVIKLMIFTKLFSCYLATFLYIVGMQFHKKVVRWQINHFYRIAAVCYEETSNLLVLYYNYTNFWSVLYFHTAFGLARPHFHTKDIKVTLELFAKW